MVILKEDNLTDMSRIFNRPMFKRGGSAGQGITSGLNRPGYNTGGSSTTDRLLKAIGQRPSGVYDFLTEWGLNMASASPTGNVLQTGAAQAKGPYERFVKGKQGEENLLRQVCFRRRRNRYKSRTSRVSS